MEIISSNPYLYFGIAFGLIAGYLIGLHLAILRYEAYRAGMSLVAYLRWWVQQ